MNKKYGITDAGTPAVSKLRSLVPGTVLNRMSTNGDYVVTINPKLKIPIEIKNNSGNQVRAIKYLPLVYRKDGQWYVIPPNVVFRKAIKRSAQHAGLSVECCNIPLSKEWKHLYNVTDDQLPEKILAAYKIGQTDTKCINIRNKCKKAIDSHRNEFKKIARSLPVQP